MPMSEAMIAPGAPVLAAACAMAGLAVALGVYLFAVKVRARAAEAAATIDETRRRRRARSDSGLSGLVTAMLAALAPVARVLLPRSVREPLIERHARAGWPGGLDDDEIVAAGLAVGLVVALLVVLVVLVVYPTAAPAGVLGVLTGPGLVSGWLSRRADERDLQIDRTMPFVLDLLVLTMRAGAPLNVAMERVAVDYTRHPIGAEFRGVLADMEMGVTRNDALENLAQRTPIPCIRTFTDDLNQAEELGRPVADALQRLSDRARERRIQEANEMAGRAKVMVLVPGMLVFVATLILLFAPFAVRYFYGGYTAGI